MNRTFSYNLSLLALALVAGFLSLQTPVDSMNPAASSRVFTVQDIHGGSHAIPDDRARATVLIFIAHDCPISCSYLPEVERIRKAYAGIPFYVIYSEPFYSAAKARAHARQYGIGSICVTDQWQSLVRWTGANTTPEAVVVDPKSKILYEGRIDNKYAGLGIYRPAATTHELRDALSAVEAGRTPPKVKAPAVGCTIEMMTSGGQS